MNRRQALAALTALPGVATVSVAQVKPDDVIVVETETLLSREGMKHIQDSLSDVWPGRRIVVLSHGMKLKVVSESQDSIANIDRDGSRRERLRKALRIS